jgi:Leucine-rich repeat (LRR) protein
METPITGDSCDNISVEERADIIFKRLIDEFEYSDELSLSINETVKVLGRLIDRIFTRDDEDLRVNSYQQMAYEWIVHNDTDQVICPDSDNLFQRYALALFYFACNGFEWTIDEGKDYLSRDSSECDWYGIACADDNSTIIGLHFDNSSIIGTLPSELSILTNIRELNMDSNQIGGKIPSWLNQWASLEVIDLDHNLLTGSIPLSLYSLSTLRVLDLDSNTLTGTISESGLENWVGSLYFLQLDFNQFVGSVPKNLGRFAELQYLSIFGNNFTDSILATIDNLCNETRLTIYANCDLCQNSTCCVACLDV